MPDEMQVPNIPAPEVPALAVKVGHHVFICGTRLVIDTRQPLSPEERHVYGPILEALQHQHVVPLTVGPIAPLNHQQIDNGRTPSAVTPTVRDDWPPKYQLIRPV